MIATLLPDNRKFWLVVLLLFPTAVGAAPSDIILRADAKLRYEHCIALANSSPAAALGVAEEWIGRRGGSPAQHCAAVSLVGLKRYGEAAARLDSLGHAPDVGALRASLFDQAGNAWMLAGNADKAVASFSAALALKGSDPDLFGDLARGEAMRQHWADADQDLSAALGLSPRRADLLLLRANARQALGHLPAARTDVEAALTLKPGNADALIERGAIARDSGDLAGARRDFEAALKAGASGDSADTARRNLAALDAAQKAAKTSPPKAPKHKP